jgi:hypothetical protein
MVWTPSKYRCYLLDGDRIAGVKIVKCVNDADAQIEAGKILAASSYKAIEIWDRSRKVSMISRTDTAA